MGNTLHSILIRLVAYVAVVIAAGLLFLAGATVYEVMWPRPVVPFSQMSRLSRRSAPKPVGRLRRVMHRLIVARSSSTGPATTAMKAW